MIGSISSRASAFASYTRPSPPGAGSKDAADSFSQALSGNNNEPNIAVASAIKLETYKPQSSVSPSSSNFDLTYNNIDHTQAEFNAHFAEGARLVSASQGLPEGQYDFSRMSSKQLFIVANDMIVNKGASPDEVDGILSMIQVGDGGINSASDKPTDFVTALTNQRDFHAGTGYAATARNSQAALEYIYNLGRK